MARPTRRVTGKGARRALLVFAEGKVTEKGYIKHLQQANRRKVTVEVHEFNGVPMSLVRKAIATKKANAKAQGRREGDAHDEVWCVFDVDEHPELKQAVNLAREHGIEVAVSNPCIELWFLLHFEDQTGYLDRDDAQRDAEAHTRCEKTLDKAALDSLDARYETAKDRARKLEKKHTGDETHFPDDNPSSGVWRIVDSIGQ